MSELSRLKKLLKEEKLKNFLLLKEIESKKKELNEYHNSIKSDTYRNTIESAEDIVFQTDINGCFIYINPAAEKNVGYKNKELIGKHFLTIIHEEYKEKIFKTLTQQLKTKSKTSYTEFPVVKKDGSIIWVGQNVQLVLSSKNIIGFSAIARDITGKIKSQEESILFNSRLESIFFNLNLGLLLEDDNRKIIMTNKKFCEIFQCDSGHEEMIGLDSNVGLFNSEQFFLHGKKQIEIFNKCRKNQKINLSQEAYLADGRILEFDYVPVFYGRNCIGHLWKYRDITELVNSKKLVSQNEEKYRLIIQNMNLGLTVVDNNEVILDANPCFTDITGYSLEEMKGKSAIELFNPDIREEIEAVASLRKQGISNAYEIQIRNKKGEKKWMLVSGSPVFDSHNNVIGSMGIHLDITERKQQIVELQEERVKAEQSAHSKEMFLANMSHEIRTPLTAIIGMTRLLESANLSPKESKYLGAIKLSSENLLVIINDILDFSKIDQGKLVLENYPFSFKTVMKNILLQFDLKAAEKNLLFSMAIDPAISKFFVGDSVRLSQILTNIVGNAVKFTNVGEVNLKCQLIRDSANVQSINFVISDTGIGIDAENIETIFESFMQENASFTRKYGGTGLGLSISRKLVKLFGGDLIVSSTKNKGTVFSFEIELNKGDDNSFPEGERKIFDTDNLKNKDILLVEDNEFNQYLATIILEELQMNVSNANNGEEAIELLLNNKYDLILMDIQMPVMDGFTATKIIRTKIKSSIPIIALTANAIKGDREKCIEIGMNDYISKPFTKYELSEKLMKLLADSETVKKLSSHVNKEIPLPVYSFEKLKYNSIGNDEFVIKMVDLFVTLAEETIVNIDKAIFEKNNIVIKSYAHKIKSSINTLEIVGLKSLVREIENAEDTYSDEFLQKITKFKENLNHVIFLLNKNELGK